DYYNTNYPQPTFVSTKKYYCHVETTAYADFDFRNPHFHELQIWEIPKYVLFETADTYLELVEKMTAVFGRQPELPDWVYN
ncbi:alpha-glucosidase, partial [Escherichia coli]|nr:alpha-glucosidase [Escherichia coli]